MSGGSFNYSYNRVNEFVETLHERLENTQRRNDWGELENMFSPKTLVLLKEIELTAARTAKLMKEAEWLYSGDTGEDTFKERVDNINNV